MKIRWLEFFVAVAEEQSVSRATVRLNTSQAALSRVIRELEATLKVELFQRTGRGMRLTAEGEVLTEAARDVLQSYSDFEAKARDISGSGVGSLRILLPMRLSAFVLRPFMASFSRKYARASAEVFEALNIDIQSQLREKKADIGLYYSPFNFDGDTGEQIASEALYIAGTPDLIGMEDTPITMAEASKLPVFMQSPPAAYRDMVEQSFVQNGHQLNVLQNLNTVDAHLQFALNGYGVTILAYSAIKRDADAGTLVARKIVEPQIRRGIYIGSASQATTHMQRDALSMLKQVAYESRETLRWDVGTD